MPSVYAHYRFGAAMLPTMPADARRTIQRFRQLFEVGLHGPDIFFYTRPIPGINAGFLGKKYHDMSGEEFFTRACRGLRMDPSEAAIAYLYGVLCHYCLDSACHPYVIESAAKGEVSHTRLEAELERHLLQLDGKIPASSYDLSQHIRLTPGECETVARFYSPASAKTVKNSVSTMAFFVKLFAAPDGIRRKALEKGVGIVSKDYADMLISDTPVALCAPYLSGLVERYEQAQEQFAEMLSQFQAHLTYGAPFGAEFQGEFG